jgi:uncharacterized membrane protein
VSLFDEFVAASSVKIVDIEWVFSAPPFLPAQSASRDNICAEKSAGDATISIKASEFLDIEENDFWIRFDRLSMPSSDPAIFVFHSRQMFDQPVTVRGAPRVQLRTVSGQIAVEMRSIPARDENDCAGHPMRYTLALATQSSFSNELRVGVTWGLIPVGINVDAITLNSLAGGEQPPDLHLVAVSLSVRRSCETPPPSRITGAVLLSREVLRSDGVVRVALAARAGGRSVRVSPSTTLFVVGSRGTFQLRLPAGFIGTVSVTATLGSDSQTREIEVVEDRNPFCLAPEMHFLLQRIRVPVFPCPDLDINDLGDLVGTQESWGYRQRSNGGSVYFRERVGGDVRRVAMNAFGEVAGSSVDGAGKFHGFVMPAEEAAAPIVLDGVQLTAINDDGLAVGYRRTKNERTAFAFALARSKSTADRAKGKPVPLTLPTSSGSEAVAVNNLGQIVVVAIIDTPRIFVLEKIGGETKQWEIGKLGELGFVRRLTDSGFLIGNEFLKGEGFRPVLVSLDAYQAKRVEVPVLKGFENAIALNVDERGTVVGRSFSPEKGESRGFRFTVGRGTEDLNSLVKLDDGSIITAAISANKRGEIVVEVADGDNFGYALLAPKSKG